MTAATTATAAAAGASAPASNPLDDARIDSAVQAVATRPEDFYDPSPALYSTLLDAASMLFSAAKQSEPAPGLLGPLDELMTEDFEAEQIWEQIQLLNDGLRNFVEAKVDTLQDVREEDLDDLGEDGEEEVDEDGMDLDDEDEFDAGRSDASSDAAFSDDDADMADLNGIDSEDDADDAARDSDADDADDAVDVMRRFEEDLDDEDADLDMDADDVDSDDDELGADLDEQAANLTYTDFFGDAPPRGHVEDIEEHADELDADEDADQDLTTRISNLFGDDDILGDDDEDLEDMDEDGVPGDGASDDEDGADGADAGPKSTFEKQAAEMAKQIEQLEFDAIQEKEWTLRGEVTSKARPVNSLLEQDLEFDTVKKPVPIVSEEFTSTLEDLIKERIIKREFDDVERKLVVQAPVYRPREEISDEKSKQSLAELYENEYMQQVTQSKSSKVVEALNEQHAEIDKMEKDLFYKLDALSNFYFTPKPVAAAAVVSSDVPAIAVEEVIPAHVSDAAMRAPEEVYDKQKNLKAKTEMSAQEKAAQRKKAKMGKRKAYEDKTKVEAALQKKKSKKDETNQALKTLLKDKNVTILNDKAKNLKEKKTIDTTGAKLRL
ncbi:u3 small nucleolar ribonucleoprotein MPP10 [Allomyces javanicus]|nr:u3 small nucleolar ribonucleoprotein MPP10 [Allomyces javanicus]